MVDLLLVWIEVFERLENNLGSKMNGEDHSQIHLEVKGTVCVVSYALLLKQIILKDKGHGRDP